MSKDYLPTAAYRIDAQYRLIGVQNVLTDILGARSIVEHFQDQPNAEEAVEAKVAAGYSGCWVFAMGINEVANQVVGDTWPYDQRLDLLMKHVGNAPVLWLTVKTLAKTGPYAATGMPAWNDALQRACQRYPNMRVYDWAGEVQVHQRHDPLHDSGIPAAQPPDRRGTGHRVLQDRRRAVRLPRPHALTRL